MSLPSNSASELSAQPCRADEVEEIRQLKARYFRFMDTKRWDCWRDLFTSGVVGVFDNEVTTNGVSGQTAPTWEGVDVLVSSIRAAIEECTTVHHGHTSEITLESATSASGIWAMSDIVVFPSGHTLYGAGHYHETYRKTDGAWRIQSIHLTRTRMEFVSPATGS
ncbi:nuclear transport factor 2 family protein [Mycobacterium hodleri]|uniref:Nuclear transport factor 2 family protein n=1 Tax=Mycolicibacterium hodleri TaxID=49897 RepID=A0A544W2X1_9MYCO|nr:nuclear transport factor 2 family protein [Mycolicibacterium hodleri]TQR86585.1 nuclear transport factor 2 family protein [Mycolicibacterium hodleri]